jgi:hypothetical protein
MTKLPRICDQSLSSSIEFQHYRVFGEYKDALRLNLFDRAYDVVGCQALDIDGHRE